MAKTKRNTTTFYASIPADLKAKLKRLADKERRDVSDVAREALEAYFAGGLEQLIEKKRRLHQETVEASGQMHLLQWMLSLSPRVRQRVVEVGEALREYEERNGDFPSSL